MTLRRPTSHYLVAIFVIAVLLRFPSLGLKSVWLDEAASVRLATPVFENVDNIHPPLYYYLLHYAMALLGDSEAAIRLPSALFSLANVGLLYLLGRRLADRKTALLAAALLAVSPLDVWYAQEARMYAAVACATLLMALGLVQGGWTGFLLYFGGLLAGLHLIYFFAPIWLVVSALWLVYWRRSGGGPLKVVLWLVTSGLAWWLFWPWFPHLWRWIGNLLEAHWSLAPLRAWLDVPALSPVTFGLVVVLGTVVVAALAWFGASLLERERWRRPITLLAAGGFVAVLLFVPVPRLYLGKRLLYTAWALVVLLVAWLALQSPTRRKLIVGILLGVSLVSSLVSAFVVPKDDWRGVAQTVQEEALDVAVWLDPGWNRLPYRYYDSEREVLHDSVAEIEEVAAQEGELWLVAERFHGRPIPSSPSEAWLDENMELMEAIPFYRLELRRYRDDS